VCVLGLRDIVDDPALVMENWHEHGIYEVLDELYDHILVYGTPLVFDPRSAYQMTPRISDKVTFCNYIAESPGAAPSDSVRARRDPDRPRITLTLGGGDGAFDTLAVPYLRMIEAWDGEPGFESIMITGPFVTPDEWRQLEPARRMGRLRRLRFVKSTRPLVSTSDLVICTAGYNTATEVVTWARRCLMIPRVLHRREQLFRGRRFAELGLVSLLEPGQVTPATLMQTIQKMLHDPREPLTEARKQGLIPTDGGRRIAAWFKEQLEQRTHRELRA
jgi:predicted glycosyltransferase